MNQATFWHLIEAAKQESYGDGRQQAAILEARLITLPPTDILDFDRLLWEAMALSYNNDLWAAAYVLNGGCSDDTFMDFRGWLIAQGEAIFHAILAHPEMLAEVGEPENMELIEMLGVARRAYETQTGKPFPQREYPPYDLTGEDWDEETVDARYPKLAAK